MYEIHDHESYGEVTIDGYHIYALRVFCTNRYDFYVRGKRRAYIHTESFDDPDDVLVESQALARDHFDHLRELVVAEVERYMYEDLVESLRRGIANIDREYVRGYYFYFTTTDPYKDFSYDKACLEMRDLFKRLGYEPSVCDTIDEDFDLNEDWWEVECPKCIRTWGYTLPVSDDVETLAAIYRLVEQNAVKFIVSALND